MTHDDHDQIERLIPWYVNGTLNEAEMDSVNHHLRHCRQCTASLDREVGHARSLRNDPPGLELMGRAEDGWKTLAGRLQPRRRRARRARALAVLVSLTLLAGAAVFLAAQQLQRPVYRTLTSPEPYGGPVVQVIFEPSTPERVIRRTVLESGGTLVAGPTTTGIYRIGLPASTDGRAAAQRLRQSPSVRWVAVEDP